MLFSRQAKLRNNQQGESLVEVLLVIVVLVLIVMLMANLPNAIGLVNKSRHIGLVREIATKEIENKRQIEYSNLVNGEENITDSRISLLPGGSGTVTIDDCNSNICTNSENIKQVRVKVNWQDRNKLQEMVLTTLIGEGGINQ